MRRFFILPEQVTKNTITLTGTEAHHITNVLRLKPGDQVEFIDGSGQVFLAQLDEPISGRVTATISAIRSEQITQPFPITLMVGVLKGKKMELVIQKATELGVHEILPLLTRYCEFKGQPEKQYLRWQRIMIEACKQCKRTTPLTISPITIFDRVDFSRFTHKVVGWEKERSSYLTADIFTTPGPICIGIGPEGGWHAREMEQLLDTGFIPVSLGPHILRGETAALAATAIVQNLISTAQL